MQNNLFRDSGCSSSAVQTPLGLAIDGSWKLGRDETTDM